MRNRAKCRLCNTIIESFHRYDAVYCKCGEIGIDGGKDIFGAEANDFSNFVRVDDEGNEILVTYVDKKEDPIRLDSKPTKKDLLKELDTYIKNIENLPITAMTAPITHYDFAGALILLSCILSRDE